MKIISILLILLLSQCKEEKKPVFKPEYTETSSPQDGILPYFKSELMDPYWPEGNKYPADLRKFSDFTLTDHNGKIITEKDLSGNYKLLVFFYAKCKGICPMITRNIQNFLPRIEDKSNLQIISITVNPEIDNPEMLRKFREMYKIKEESWVFLTGSKNFIFDLARKQFGAEVKVLLGQNDLTDFVHTENVYLIDRKNYLRGIYRAKGTGDLERLLVEMKTLRQEDFGKKL
ncbi:MAG TPA: SCO family protein [Leptospiraceae bacterium]|nr:SCO family protein [Leptospiraceae bacterium]HNF13877.1 SCO family protein [Leptospiraceae bacterium]HNF26185.1 SCO family protein [Leptospiraceae bacterium]HNI95060.1 SCO family protein [Leptospiraceae bacterium]HNM04934.1 SCO family protein [Leptospiraceae bacterium]